MITFPMTLTIELPDDEKAALLAKARAHGVSAEEIDPEIAAARRDRGTRL